MCVESVEAGTEAGTEAEAGTVTEATSFGFSGVNC